MNLRLALASIWLPRRVKRRKLAQLLRRTAEAFGAPVPNVRDQSPAECLRTFAAFSNVQAERALAGSAPQAEAVAARLRAAARELGDEIRRELGIGNMNEGMRAAWLLYRTLGIDFDGEADGGISIRRCYFADWYSPRVCAFMSALDEGVLAGLMGEGRLEFAGRITDGRHRCSAMFRAAAQEWPAVGSSPFAMAMPRGGGDPDAGGPPLADAAMDASPGAAALPAPAGSPAEGAAR